MRKSALAAGLAAILLLVFYSCAANKTRQLLEGGSVEEIRVRYMMPFDQKDYEYIVTPDLHVTWNEYHIWDGTLDQTHEKVLTQQQYDDVIAAFIDNDFAAMPEEHKKWQGADGPSQDIEIQVDGVTYRSGGYYPSDTSRAFSKLWDALKEAGVISQQGYESGFW